MKKLVITIDGPAGAGKSTVSKILAVRLGYRYIDTGALYRAVAYEAKRSGVNPDDQDDALEYVCRHLDIKFVSEKNGQRLIVNGSDITDFIRTPEVTMLSSAVSARAVVRKYLFDLQREMGKGRGAVFEGRDMGTVVFPDADIKFFLDAASHTRALRRFNELKSQPAINLEKVERDILRRDHNDSTRNLAPLIPAQDAVIIDSTDLNAQQVVEHMISYIRMRLVEGLED